MYDVIVVGARCAGAPVAMLLARKSYKVLLVDRATFPSDIPHGHLIHRHGPRRLQAWGLLDRVVATGCPAVTAFTFDAGDFPLTGHDLILDGVAMGYGPRRAALDHVLAAAAAEAGAELREGFTVEEFTGEAGRITGVRGRTRNGATPVTERATVTIGADGRNSRLARTVQAPADQAVPTLACWYFSYWSDVQGRALEIYAKDKRVIFAFPTNDGLFAVFIAWPIEELPAVKSDIESQFMAALSLAPELAERVRAGHREERLYGATDLPHFLRRPYGEGWALVGDAGAHKDPYLALGVCDAFRDAEWLAEALDQGLSGRRPMESALAEYERRRNEATMADYQESLERARFTPFPDQFYRLRAALRGNQLETNRFFMAREGMMAAAATESR